MFITSSCLTSTCFHNNPTNRHKFHPKFFFNPNSVSNRHVCSFWANPNFDYLRTGPTIETQNRRSEMDFVLYGNDQPEDLKPLGTLLHSWINWIPGILATIILPLLAKKLGPFAKLKDEVDMVEETVIKVADNIEQAAEKIEKVVEDIAEDLPEGGKFKNALTYVDDVAKEAAKDAQLTRDIVDKVEEMEKEVDSLMDSIAESSDKSKPE